MGGGCKHKPLITDEEPEPTAPVSIPFPGNGIPCQPGIVYFQNDVLPLFVSRCAFSGCHDAVSRQNGIELTSYQSIMASGEITPFNPNEGHIVKAITETDPDKQMPPPPHAALSASQVLLITQWIAQGAQNNACENCDTLNVTWSGYVRPIIENKCQGCHSGVDPYVNSNLNNHNEVSSLALSGLLYGVISHTPGFPYMPKFLPKLPNCEIAGIKKWIDDGAPDN